MKTIEPDYEKILNFYRITSSPLRIEILKAIFDSHVEFTCKQITDKMNRRKTTIKPGTIARVIRLYTMRGLLNQTANKTNKQGRPTIHYILSGLHILSNREADSTYIHPCDEI
jgi:Fe2+ or Zn2+ uptake regulation protein